MSAALELTKEAPAPVPDASLADRIRLLLGRHVGPFEANELARMADRLASDLLSAQNTARFASDVIADYRSFMRDVRDMRRAQKAFATERSEDASIRKIKAERKVDDYLTTERIP